MTAEYLISKMDHLVTSILDALKIVSAKHRNADCNHIFMNFMYNLNVIYKDVLEAISGFIEHHEGQDPGQRVYSTMVNLWRKAVGEWAYPFGL